MSTQVDSHNSRHMRAWMVVMLVIGMTLLGELTLIFLAASEVVPSNVGSFALTAMLVTSVPMIVANRFRPKVAVKAGLPNPHHRRWVWITVTVAWGLGLIQILIAIVFMRWPWPGTLLISGSVFLLSGAITLWMTRGKAPSSDR